MGKILKKITLREMGLDKTALLDATRAVTPVIEHKTIKDAAGHDVSVPSKWAQQGPAVKVAQFIGSVSAVKPGEVKDTGQSYAKLIGQYEAINLLTGEAFSECSTLILPNFIGDNIAAALMAGAKAVDFAVVVTAAYDVTSAVGYVFGAESLMPAQQADSVQAIKARLGQLGIALAAPKQAPALEAPKPEADADAAKMESEGAPAVETPAPAPAPAPAEAPAAAKGKGRATARA